MKHFWLWSELCWPRSHDKAVHKFPVSGKFTATGLHHKICIQFGAYVCRFGIYQNGRASMVLTSYVHDVWVIELCSWVSTETSSLSIAFIYSNWNGVLILSTYLNGMPHVIAQIYGQKNIRYLTYIHHFPTPICYPLIKRFFQHHLNSHQRPVSSTI